MMASIVVFLKYRIKSQAIKTEKPSEETKTNRSFMIIPTVKNRLETIENVIMKKAIEKTTSFFFFQFFARYIIKLRIPRSETKTNGSESLR